MYSTCVHTYVCVYIYIQEKVIIVYIFYIYQCL